MHITTDKAFGGSELAPFTAFFKNIDADADAIIGEGAADIARLAEFEVIATAYRTGRLSEGFAVQKIRNLKYRISNMVHYAEVVPEGWGHQPYARPFMTRAIDTHGDKTTNRLKALLQTGRSSAGGAKMSVEEAMGIGALSDEDWNFEKTRRVNYGAVKPGFEYTWTHLEFARGMAIERKLMDDNLFANSELPRKITKKPVQMADSAYVLREKAAAEFFNYATTGSGLSPLGFPLVGGEGVALASNSHKLYPGAGAGEVQDNYFAGLDLTADNYSTVRQNMRAFTDDNGNIVQVNPTTLIVPPEMEDKALTIRDSQNKPGTANNDANVVVSCSSECVYSTSHGCK